MGKRLARHRDRNGLSQRELAHHLFYDRTSITKIETGQQSAPQTFWCEADRLLDADGELVAAFHALAATREDLLETHSSDTPIHLLFDALTATAPTERGPHSTQSPSAFLEHINTVIELQVLANELTEYSRHVLMGDFVDWTKIAYKLAQAAKSCRFHIAAQHPDEAKLPDRREAWAYPMIGVSGVVGQ